jgi:hypothetical protein
MNSYFSVSISTFVFYREPLWISTCISDFFHPFSMFTLFFFLHSISNSPVIVSVSFCVIFQAFDATYMRPTFFWDVTQLVLVVVYRRFGTAWQYLEDETGKHLPLYAACLSQKNEGIKFIFSFRVQNLLIQENSFSTSAIFFPNLLLLSRDLNDVTKGTVLFCIPTVNTLVFFWGFVHYVIYSEKFSYFVFYIIFRCQMWCLIFQVITFISIIIFDPILLFCSAL